MSVKETSVTYLTRLNLDTIQEVYSFLDLPTAASFSLTCRARRRDFLSEYIQRELLQIAYPNLPHHHHLLPSEWLLRCRVRTSKQNHPVCNMTISDATTTSTVNCMAVSQNEKWGLYHSYDTSVLHLVDFTKGEEIRTFSMDFDGAFSSSPSCLQVSDDGSKALVSYPMGTLTLWDLSTGTQKKIEDHSGTVHFLQINEDGTRALSGSDQTVEFLDLIEAKVLYKLETKGYPNCLQMSKDCERVLCGYREGIVELFEVGTKEPLMTSSWVPAIATCVWISDDGTSGIVGYGNGTLQIWNLKDFRCTMTLQLPNKGVVKQVVVDQNRITSVSVDDAWEVTQFEFATGKCLNNSKLSTKSLCVFRVVALNRSGTKLFSGLHGISVWDLTPPLPQDRVTQVATALFRNDPDALEFFSMLPSFVRRQAYGTLSTLHASTAKKALHPNYGSNAFRNISGCSATNIERGTTLSKYCKQQFLPDVVDLLSKIAFTSDRADPSKEKFILTVDENSLFQAACQRLEKLPADVQHSVYSALHEAHEKNGKLPSPVPPDYGKYAFHDRNGCSAAHDERIDALQKVISSIRIKSLQAR